LKPRGKFYRLNYFIQASELRLLDAQGKQIGIIKKEEALRMAREQGIDVVEISASANPPVAKLIDFKKFKYLEAKREQEEKRKQKHVGIKEVRVRPFIGEHDLEVRVTQAQSFLNAGNQLKIAVPFRGREITHKEFGFDVLKRFTDRLKEFKMVRPGHMEGRVLVAMLAPQKSNPKLPTTETT
jgi:translation initiation factor IF-3